MTAGLLFAAVLGFADAPPKAPNAWTAGEGFFPEYPEAWRAFHKNFTERAKKGDADIVFLGDSITQGWGGKGKKVWAEFYEPRKAVNFGIGGDGTPQILWRLQHGTLDGLKPKVVVLMIGTNNRWRGDGTAENIAKGIEACVKQIREKAPDSRLLLLGIFPTAEKPSHRDRKLFTDTNAAISKFADGKHVDFLDIGEKFLEPDGRIAKETMPDFLHLSEKAYQTWAEAMEPTLKRLLAGK
jgi:lysophospholipase L1-like esterase